MRLRMLKLLTLAAIVGAFGQSQALAQFRFRNSTSKTLNVAYVRYMPSCQGLWEKRGWWVIQPGGTVVVQGEPISSRYCYFYAESSDLAWLWTAASPTACMPRTAFTWCWTTCDSAPNTRYYGFRQVDTGTSTNYTLNLTPPAAGSPLPASRLGEDPIQSIDGAGGKTALQIPAGSGAPAAKGSPTASGSSDAAGDASATSGATSEPVNSPASNHGAASSTPTQQHPKPMPASPHAVIVAQPDGTSITLKIVGDEKRNMQTDLHGNPVTKAADGRYVYAAVDADGQLKATERVVGDDTSSGSHKGRPAGSDPMGDNTNQPSTDPMGQSNSM